MSKFIGGASASALAIAIASPAVAQDNTAQPEAEQPEQRGGVKTIVVTAQKRSEDLQDVPVSVAAIGAEQLDELNIDTFEDYLEQLPTVTAGGNGPGQSTIYIRGLASTTPNITVAGVAGLAPNVALYLNDQPLAQPGRNLDVYAADLERIEVLSGPQGTLFGASSQAGVVRLITNKPSLNGFDAAFSAGVSFTKGGEASYQGEAMVNVPVSDNIALRGVVYLDDKGGYIDNVAGTRSLRESGRFRPAGTVRSNGVPVNANRGGFQSDAATLALIDANVDFIEADNAGIAQDNFNDTQYAGFRVSGLWEVTPDWTVTVAHQRQSLESDGVFFADPELNGLDDLEIERFEEDRLEDNFSNTSWTVEGRLAMLDVVYTGAYTDRESTQRADYTDYLFVGQYLPYYICDGGVTYPGAGGPAGTCQAPNLYINSFSKTEVFTQELRFSTPDDWRIRFQGGGFYSDLSLEERVDFAYPGNVAAQPFGPFAPNFPQDTGFTSLDGPFPAETIFRNDIRRTDEQFGFFGEASLDVVPDLLTVTFGARYYDIEVDFEGSANGSFCNSGGTDQNAFGTDISDLYDGDGQFTFIGSCDPALRQTFDLNDSLADIEAAGLSATQAQQVFNAVRAPDVAATDGVIVKGTVTLTPNEDLLFYATYSEGFRPGLLNRPGGAAGPNGFTVPFAVDTDEVKNYELGWKMDLIDGQFRFNGSAFFVDISNLQTQIFDPSITNLFFSDNAANAEIYGVEADFTIAPYATPGLTIAGAFSILDTEITEVLTPTTDVIAGSELAFAPGFQGNLRMRYEWDLSSSTEAYIQPQVSYSGSKFTDIIQINNIELDSYTIVDLRAGIKKDQWSFEIFGENLFDERAQISGNFGNDRARIVTNRPLTVGMRVGFDY
ncbi:TonB-dependent receptor plug domain-containing protein [Erythrobacter sp. F6033]|uniref:TonB-dependent receptor n=1 Tax=Erythrobacter sp. F6033 TaxID=2926401 RepID=UPI001FF6D865|nr:TonB-dependent receptor plug domain-containing protein [Erythrobacter sp. F6033]MCK0127671.1 TonB-dependent receptor plug domain-containing protein [Erythrobacter sp. F6033]